MFGSDKIYFGTLEVTDPISTSHFSVRKIKSRYFSEDPEYFECL